MQSLFQQGESVAGFARRVGVPAANVHTYLRGMNPQVDKLVRIATACGVTVDWLATGQGIRLASDLQAVETSMQNAKTRAQGATATFDDLQRLKTAIATIEEGLGGKPLSPEKKAEAVMLVYALLTNPAVRRDSVVALLTKVV